MQFVNDDMDDMFRQAAEEYPLKTDSGDWDKVLDKMQAGGKGKIPERKVKGRYLLLLVSIPLLLICTTYIKNDSSKNGTSVSPKNKIPIAIVLDNTVYSAPVAEGKIDGGQSRITGNFTVEEAKDLASILKVGKLPAPAKIVQEQVVGPTLGKEAIAGGLKAFVIAFIVIFLLMLIYYNSSAWITNIALILNRLFTIGILTGLGATLTAPGIAGLILTIGLAVDTNVIAKERIKEELTKGKRESRDQK